MSCTKITYFGVPIETDTDNQNGYRSASLLVQMLFKDIMLHHMKL